MKKLFISQPMRGLSDDEILNKREEIKRKAEKRMGESIELIDSFVTDYPAKLTNLFLFGI